MSVRAEQQDDRGGGSGRKSSNSGPARREKRPTSFGALRAASQRLSRIAQKGARQVNENPLAAVAGAAAVSAGLALLLPAGRREAEMMGDLAGKVGDAARDAAENVVEIGRTEVETLAQSALAGVGSAVVEALAASERSGTASAD